MVIDTSLATDAEYNLPEAMGAADGQSADRSGSLQLVSSSFKAGPAGRPSSAGKSAEPGALFQQEDHRFADVRWRRQGPIRPTVEVVRSQPQAPARPSGGSTMAGEQSIIRIWTDRKIFAPLGG
jgi:hypothetical protein